LRKIGKKKYIGNVIIQDAVALHEIFKPQRQGEFDPATAG
jgi:hypothetical protein